MSLPLIFPPSSLPLFLGAGHGISLGSEYAGVARGRGHGRKRHKSTGAPRIVSVAWRLTQAQMTDLDFWFEKSLNVGVEAFTAEVANQGPGRLFWKANWVRPYRSVPQPTPQGILWTVTGNILLSGEGEASRPTTGEMAAEIMVALLGSATLVLPDTPLAAEIVVALEAITPLAAEITVALLSTVLPLSAEITVALLGSAEFSAGASGTTLTIEEEDGSPSAAPQRLIFPNGTLDIDSDGNVHYTPSASGAGAVVKGAAWDGAGFPIGAGASLTDVAVYCPVAFTISKVTVLTRGGTGSCVIDVWNDTYANYPPTVLNTITAAAKPTISSTTKYQDATLTGWSLSVVAGDVLMFHVDSTSVFTFISILLEGA